MNEKGKGKERPNDEIEEALLKRALGFKQEEIYAEDLIDRKSGEILEITKRRIVTKEVAPDVRALLFWLKNRKPDRWSDRIETTEVVKFKFNNDEKSL